MRILSGVSLFVAGLVFSGVSVSGQHSCGSLNNNCEVVLFSWPAEQDLGQNCSWTMFEDVPVLECVSSDSAQAFIFENGEPEEP